MNVVVSTGSSLSWHTFKYLSDPFPQDQIYDHRLQLTGKGMLFLNHTLWSHIDKASSALCTWAVNCVSICFDRCINMRGLSLSLSPLSMHHQDANLNLNNQAVDIVAAVYTTALTPFMRKLLLSLLWVVVRCASSLVAVVFSPHSAALTLP